MRGRGGATGARMPACGHGQIGDAELAQRGQGGAGGGPRAQHDGAPPTRRGLTGTGRWHRRLAQGADDPGHIGVEARQQGGTRPRTLRHNGVDHADDGRQGVDDVEHRQQGPLMRHGHAQPGPYRLPLGWGGHLSENPLELRGLHRHGPVGPILQAQTAVGGPMQDRGQGMRDRPADDGGPMPALWRADSTHCPSPAPALGVAEPVAPLPLPPSQTPGFWLQYSVSFLVFSSCSA